MTLLAGCQVASLFLLCIGDLHFYMRHSFSPYQPPAQAASQTPGSPASGADGRASAFHQRSADGTKASNKSGVFVAKANATAAALQASLLEKLRPSTAHSHRKSKQPAQATIAEAEQPAPDSSTASVASTEDPCDARLLSEDGASTSSTAGWHPHDPEHLIVNGLGGAFLHPTHVFSPSRFISVPDPSADEATVTNTRPTANAQPRGRSPVRGSSPRGSSPSRPSPRGSSPISNLTKRFSLATADQGDHTPWLWLAHELLLKLHMLASRQPSSVHTKALHTQSLHGPCKP